VLRQRSARVLRQLSLVVIACLCVGGCRRQAGDVVVRPADEKVRVGAFMSLTGDTAQYGISAYNGIRMAVEEANGAGGVNGRRVELLAQLERLRACDRPIVIGVSRKSFLGKLINSVQISDRLAPAVALTSLLRARGADVFRVHDVKENAHALKVTEAILQRTK